MREVGFIYKDSFANNANIQDDLQKHVSPTELNCLLASFHKHVQSLLLSL